MNKNKYMACNEILSGWKLKTKTKRTFQTTQPPTPNPLAAILSAIAARQGGPIPEEWGGGQAGEMQRGAHMQPPGTRGTGLRVVSGDTRANAGGKDTAEAWMVAGLVGIFGGSVGWCVWGKTHLPNPFQGGGVIGPKTCPSTWPTARQKGQIFPSGANCYAFLA